MVAGPGFVTRAAGGLFRGPKLDSEGACRCGRAPALPRRSHGRSSVGKDKIPNMEGVSPGTQLRKRAKQLDALGKQDEARKLYEQCIQIEPGLGKAWRDLAKMELRVRTGSSKSRAVDILKQGIAANPNNSHLRITLGNAELRRGKVREARKAFKSSLDLDSSAGNLHGYFAMARFEALQGNLETSRELFSKLIRLSRTESSRTSDLQLSSKMKSLRARAYHAWGIAEQKALYLKRAMDLFRLGLMEEPHNTFILVTLGQIFATEGKVDDARICFSRAAEKVKRDLQNSLTEVVRQDPGERAFVLECWGRLETRLGQWDEAQALFREAYESAPWDGAVLVGLSSVEMSLGNVEEARNLAVLGIQKHPHSSLVWRNFAMIEAMQGNAEECRACFFHALKEDPNDWLIYEDWFDAEMYLGTDVETARQFLDESFAMRLYAKGEASALCCTLEDKHRVNALATAQRRQLRGVKNFVRQREGPPR